MTHNYKIVDLFCGAGGFSKGFENTEKFSVLLGIDNDLNALKTFEINHKKAKTICTDIRHVKDETIREFKENQGKIDVVIGGPPCQGFSSIRPFRSINAEDPRNNLYEEFGRFLWLLKPRVFVLENVVGLLTHRKGKSLQEIMSEFRRLKYNISYAVMNAVHYGVPQRRERLIILGGHFEEIDFPNPTNFYNNGRSMVKKDFRVSMMEKGQKTLMECDTSKKIQKLFPALTVMDAIGDLPPVKSGEQVTEYLDSYPTTSYQKARRKNQKKLTLHKSTAHTARMLKIIKKAGTNRYALPEGMTTSGFSTSYSRLDPNEPSVTLTVNFVHPASNKCIHPYQDRALTPREGARLQSFDDDFSFYGNRASIVRQIGNAVPPLLGKAIAYKIANFLDAEEF